MHPSLPGISNAGCMALKVAWKALTEPIQCRAGNSRNQQPNFKYNKRVKEDKKVLYRVHQVITWWQSRKRSNSHSTWVSTKEVTCNSPTTLLLPGKSKHAIRGGASCLPGCRMLFQSPLERIWKNSQPGTGGCLFSCFSDVFVPSCLGKHCSNQSNSDISTLFLNRAQMQGNKSGQLQVCTNNIEAAFCVRNHRSMLKMARWQNPLLCCHTWSHQKLQFHLCSSQQQTLQNKGQMTQDLPYWTIQLAECWPSMRTLWMSEWSVVSTQDVFPASHRHRHTADVALPESIKAWGIQW